jgi:acyl phosphate:glycerol-3-phosphate acyltransferase
MIYIQLAASAIIGYLLGSINSSIVVGQFYGVDVRNHGSGNAGATNTLRTIGKKAALFTTLGDILKGVIACLLGMIVYNSLSYDRYNIGMMIAGAFTIIGHNWPIFFKFKGGKGVLTSVAVTAMIDWKMALLLLGTFIIVTFISRYVSLGSIIASVAFPIISLVMKKDSNYLTFALFVAFLVVLRHKTNINRIISGKESKIGKNN